MLKNLVLLILVLGFISCKKDQNEGFKISATTDSHITGSTARLFNVVNQKKNVLDSTVLESGTFIFEGKVNSPDRYYITIDNVLGVFPLIVANETFKLEIVTDSIAASKIIGSDANTVVENYIESLDYLREAHGELSDKFKKYRIANDKEGMEAVKFSYDSLILESVKHDVTFIKKHPNTVLSALHLDRITMAKQVTEKETKALYNTLSEEIQNTRAAKHALEFIEKQNKKEVNEN